ncbi:TPA: DNA alkylation repair protein [Candidatus Dependentiae bacterium]|nr:MAG: hypothetical protein UW09_C0001G0319 [candidate division TM6 bacterium GW2011_GWF2_43_87]HBL98316.1 DNA alkylation repair protein [Candidatus Dependentiae bacterium]
MKKTTHYTAESILEILKSEQNPETVTGLKRFAAGGAVTLGIPMPRLRALAKEIGKNHTIALDLWKSGIHEARILASIVEEPALVQEDQVDEWVKDFDSWDICDQCCLNLLKKLPFAVKKIHVWSQREETFVKRTAFALIACLCHGNKKTDDALFISFFPLIQAASTDDRNFVKKAINWALRQIGKRNSTLNQLAQQEAIELINSGNKCAIWIGKDALRELQKKAMFLP